mmetsp:Transcript_10811/g.13586  ORF Transcript_10811/g.13586 Transcript_10811/m.13586 type:complete len:107 (+) Transcript_10811:406-726(+)
MSREPAGAELASLTSLILSKVARSKVFVVGGSDEMTLSLMQALDSTDTPAFRLLHLDPAIDVKPKHVRKVDLQAPTLHETNQSYLRTIYTDETRLNKLREVTFLGV